MLPFAARAHDAATLRRVSFGQILILAIGVAMDAMAVAAARGCAARELPTSEVVWTALLFGGAQALMPTLGWWLGEAVGRWVASIDHWVAFLVLGALGVKMLREAATFEPQKDASPRSLRMLLGLALATSIDAFAVGITLPLLDAPFALSIVTIGLVTMVLTAVGSVAGRHFSAMLGRRLDAFGGIVLILLGFKILTEHLLHDT